MKRDDVDSTLTESVVVRVSKKERTLLNKYADKEGWSVSEYIRATMLTEMAMMQGDIEAMQIIFNSAKRKLADRFTRKFQPFQREKAGSYRP